MEARDRTRSARVLLGSVTSKLGHWHGHGHGHGRDMHFTFIQTTLPETMTLMLMLMLKRSYPCERAATCNFLSYP